MLETILEHLHNWFPVKDGVKRGTFKVVSGVLEADFIAENQYYRIKGSIFNDGLYQRGNNDTLTDESFIGEVWALAIPRRLITLADKIKAWRDANPETDKVSESFGGYSYSKGGSGTQNADVGGWQTAFGKELSVWKKVE